MSESDTGGGAGPSGVRAGGTTEPARRAWQENAFSPRWPFETAMERVAAGVGSGRREGPEHRGRGPQAVLGLVDDRRAAGIEHAVAHDNVAAHRQAVQEEGVVGLLEHPLVDHPARAQPLLDAPLLLEAAVVVERAPLLRAHDARAAHGRVHVVGLDEAAALRLGARAARTTSGSSPKPSGRKRVTCMPRSAAATSWLWGVATGSDFGCQVQVSTYFFPRGTGRRSWIVSASASPCSGCQRFDSRLITGTSANSVKRWRNSSFASSP